MYLFCPHLMKDVSKRREEFWDPQESLAKVNDGAAAAAVGHQDEIFRSFTGCKPADLSLKDRNLQITTQIITHTEALPTILNKILPGQSARSQLILSILSLQCPCPVHVLTVKGALQIVGQGPICRQCQLPGPAGSHTQPSAKSDS